MVVEVVLLLACLLIEVHTFSKCLLEGSAVYEGAGATGGGLRGSGGPAVCKIDVSVALSLCEYRREGGCVLDEAMKDGRTENSGHWAHAWVGLCFLVRSFES